MLSVDGMETSHLVRLDGSVLVNPAHIVSVVPAPMLSNATRLDIRMSNGDTHSWPIRSDEDLEGSLRRLMLSLAYGG
jgi:hypothetical protein